MRLQRLNWVFLLISVLLAKGYTQSNDQQVMLDTFDCEEDIIFKTVNGESLSMTHFKPQNENPKNGVPWMLFIHGGGWRGGDKYAILKPSFLGALRRLTENGIACFTIDYRLTRDHSTAFESVTDCKDAARFLLENAEKFNLDLNKYGVWGGSAGGHLSLVTALGNDDDFLALTSSPQPPLAFKCVVSYYPLTTLINPDVLKGSKFEDPEVLRHVLDGLFSEKPKLARLLSPTEYLSKQTPPILLLHGEEDTTLSIRNSLYMLSVAQEKNAHVELVTVKNAEHGFKGKNLSPSIHELDKISSSFITYHLLKE